jgi:Zn-dependent protease with chaperone function
MSVMVNGIVRQLEFAADRYAVSLGYDIRLALLDLSKENLGDLNPDPW